MILPCLDNFTSNAAELETGPTALVHDRATSDSHTFALCVIASRHAHICHAVVRPRNGLPRHGCATVAKSASGRFNEQSATRAITEQSARGVRRELTRLARAVRWVFLLIIEACEELLDLGALAADWYASDVTRVSKGLSRSWAPPSALSCTELHASTSYQTRPHAATMHVHGSLPSTVPCSGDSRLLKEWSEVACNCTSRQLFKISL